MDSNMRQDEDVPYESDDNTCAITIDADGTVDLCIADDGEGFGTVEDVLSFEQFAALVRAIRRVPHDVMRKVMR